MSPPVISACITLGALIVGLLNWYGFSLKSKIIYNVVSVEGTLPKVADVLLDREITANLFYFQNRSWRHLRDVQIRIASIRNCMSYRVSSDRGFDDKSINLSEKTDSLLILVPELPAGSSFQVHVFEESFLASPRAQGAGPTYKVVAKDELTHLWWLLITVVSILISASLITVGQIYHG